MRRYPVLLATLMVLLLGAVPRLRALTDEEKREEFLEARGEADSSESGSPSPSPHHHHRHSSTPDAGETEAPEETPAPAPEETPRHRHHHHPTPHPHTGEAETPAPSPSQTPPAAKHALRAPTPPSYQPYSSSSSSQSYTAPVATPLPAAQPRPTPAPTPPPGPWGAQVEVEKEGLEQEGGYEPPPPPPRHHWWQFFSHEPEPQYRFLTWEIREAIDRAPVARRRWRFIVVHNSGTRQGNARIFDYYHRYVRKMPNGLAYHFVIGNGTSSGNGQIEIGNRWTRQINGGHVHSDYLNNIALGICLVGDFNRDLPTKEQLEALDELIRYLRIRVGKIDGKPAIVKAHKEINPPQWPTDCPGDRFPYHWLHSRFG